MMIADDEATICIEVRQSWCENQPGGERDAMVIGAMPMPAETSDTARLRWVSNQAVDTRHHPAQRWRRRRRPTISPEGRTETRPAMWRGWPARDLPPAPPSPVKNHRTAAPGRSDKGAPDHAGSTPWQEIRWSWRWTPR